MTPASNDTPAAAAAPKPEDSAASPVSSLISRLAAIGAFRQQRANQNRPKPKTRGAFGGTARRNRVQPAGFAQPIAPNTDTSSAQETAA
jgi:hypothetical protein